jgi:trigger factor
LRRVFGKSLGQEILADLISRHIEKAIDEHGLKAIGQPQIDAKEVEENKDYGFVVKLELRPVLEKIEYEGIELRRSKIQIQKEDVDRELSRLRSSAAQIINLDKPRPAQTGDLVKARVKRWQKGEWRDFSSNEQSIVVGESPFGREFDEAVVGLSAGEEKVIDLGSQEELDENRIRYLVNVSSVQGRELPDLDDAFAKDLGEFQSLDDLKAAIEENLRMGIERTEEKRLTHELFKALREKNPMDLPEGLVSRQAHSLQHNMEDLRARIGSGELSADERNKLAEVAGAQARQMVHQHLLTHEFSRLENIEVSDDEIDEVVGNMAEAQGIPAPMLRAEYGKDENKERLRSELLERKMFDFAMRKVKIIEGDVSDELTEKDDGGKESP